MSKFLITGARGQDGTLAIELLNLLGHEAVALSHSLLSDDELIDESIISYVWDWKDISRICEILEETRPDFILNFATCHHSSQVDFRDIGTHSRMLEVNILGLENIIQGILKVSKNIALVHSSSSQIYTPTKLADIVAEERVPDPSTIYGVTKFSGMKLIDYYKKQHGLIASSVILFNHESEYRSNEFLTRLVSQQAIKIKHGYADNLHLKNIGAYADFSAARDVVEAIVQICLNDRFDTYVISSNKATSAKAIVEFVFDKLDLDWTQYTTFDKNETLPYLIGDNEKIKRVLEWEPRYNMKSTLEHMVDYDLAQLKA